MATETLVKLVVATAELMGAELSLDAARLLCDDLSIYPEPMVAKALSRCRKELAGQRTLRPADIISRLDDGRPGPEEAWGMYPQNEWDTAVVTSEMNQAMRHAWPLLRAGERVAARMAFKEAYTRITTEARDQGAPVRWEVTLGHDKHGREAPILEAVQLGRIGSSQAIHALSHLPDAQERVMLAMSANANARLAAPGAAGGDISGRADEVVRQAAKLLTSGPGERTRRGGE